MPLPVTPLYFSMRNVSQCQSDDLVYTSEPFYSHAGGYKMKVSVHPNGSQNFRSAYLSFYVCILRGEFDDQLRWPFNGIITTEAYNRTTGQWSNERTIVMNEQRCGLENVERPVDALTCGNWGYRDYLSLSELKDNYVKETNIVRFRITKVEICN